MDENEINVVGDDYFKSYENFGVHRLMLDDKPRTEAYKNAILSTPENFKDKVVMDVGAGTGILSLFCAQAGAKKVYAVEASGLAQVVKEIAKENNLENVIEVLHCRVEDVCEDIKVDVIVSEWMGFFLLHESMIDSVICARDNHLNPGGIIYPEKAILKCAPCSTPNLLDFWDNVYGFPMAAMKNAVRKSLAAKPEITTLKPEELLSEARDVISIDMNTVSVYDVTQITSRIFVSTEKSGIYQGVGFWFDVLFPSAQEEKVKLSTSPVALVTHWQQTVVVWPEDQTVEDGDILGFEIQFERDETETRRYNIHLKELDAAEEEHPVPCDCGAARCNIVKAFLEKFEEEEEEDSDMGEENPSK